MMHQLSDLPIVFNSNNFKPQKSPRYYIILVILVIGFGMSAYYKSHIDFEGVFSNLLVLFGIFIALAAFVFLVWSIFFHKKVNKICSIDSEGITVGDKKYSWGNISNYHMLGDSQDERIGLVSLPIIGADLLNTHAGESIYVLKLKSLISQRTISIQVSHDRSEEFEKLLTTYGIKRGSNVKMFLFGLNTWLVVLLGIILLPILIMYFLQ